MLIAETAAIAARWRATRAEWRIAVARMRRGRSRRFGARKQILLNLVNNASSSPSMGLSLELAPTRRHDATARASGASPSRRARLFQRFERADGARRHGGSGLGLAIAANLSHAWAVISRSTASRAGSTFCGTCLPEADATGAEAGAASSDPAAGPPASTRPLRSCLSKTIRPAGNRDCSRFTATP
jgi:light-regulated signal transduction histidine kinase (bacteriophytochrome)